MTEPRQQQRITASAPGKLVLSGEYAVLDGAPAICMAVDRRARVTISASGEEFINLSRGRELAKDLRNAENEELADTLKKAMEDIFRITKAFFKTLKKGFEVMKLGSFFWR